MYGNAKLHDGTVFLVELKMNSSFSSCDVSIKTYASHLAGLFFQILEAMLKSP